MCVVVVAFHRLEWCMTVLSALFMLGCVPSPEPCSKMGNGVGECAPALELPQANGEPWSLAKQQNRVVLVQFAAAWCGSCQATAPVHQALHDAYSADGFTKVTVLKGDADFASADQADAQEWTDYFGLTHPVLYDEDKVAWKAWRRESSSVPQLFLVDGEGAIRWRKIGVVSQDVLIEHIEESLQHLE